ncbi:uncharacterized protein LOC113281212 [Papaver somniferum]|uniref:uncharacterized protein LOC113281212 n=1 Tax=Papaver somniferum TaxID=3469 RepID=UPI000E700C79|nr:uncharacterized protein LOC113281212 [Papaver somniferum]
MCVVKCEGTRLPVLHSTSACPWSVQVLDIKGAAKNFLQFKCELLEVCTMCLILLDANTKISVHDLLLDYGYGFKLWHRNSRVMANYSGKFIYAFVFKFGYSLRLLCARSTTILFVQGAETGVVCKLRNTRLQHGTVLWSRLILQVTCTNAAGTMMELFDQLHHSRWSFYNLLILQLGNGSRNSLNFCVVASQYAGESQILSKRLHYKLMFLSLRASHMCDVPQILLQELLNFSVLLFLVHTIVRTRLSLSQIDPFRHSKLLTSEVFSWFIIQERVILTTTHFNWNSLHNELSILGRGLSIHYRLPSPHVYISCLLPVGMILGTQILVVVFLILKMFLWVGYLKWKFRFPPGLSSMRNVRWVANNLISVVCTMLQWDTTLWNSVVIQVLKYYHAEKAKEWASRRHENCVWSSLIVGTYIKTVGAKGRISPAVQDGDIFGVEFSSGGGCGTNIDRNLQYLVMLNRTM